MSKETYKTQGLAQQSFIFKADYEHDVNGMYRIWLVKPTEESEDLVNFINKMVDEKLVSVKEEEAKARKGRKVKTEFPLVYPYFAWEDKEGNETGETCFKFRMKHKVDTQKGSFTQKPLVVDAKRKPMSGEAEIGNGSVVKVAFEPYSWYVKGDVGVSLRLKAVQVLDFIPYTGSQAEALFDEEEGYSDSSGEDFAEDFGYEYGSHNDSEDDNEAQGDF